MLVAGSIRCAQRKAAAKGKTIKHPGSKLPHQFTQYTRKLTHHEILHTAILSPCDPSKPLTVCLGRYSVCNCISCKAHKPPARRTSGSCRFQAETGLSACLSRPRHEISERSYCHTTSENDEPSSARRAQHCLQEVQVQPSVLRSYDPNCQGDSVRITWPQQGIDWKGGEETASHPH